MTHVPTSGAFNPTYTSDHLISSSSSSSHHRSHSHSHFHSHPTQPQIGDRTANNSSAGIDSSYAIQSDSTSSPSTSRIGGGGPSLPSPSPSPSPSSIVPSSSTFPSSSSSFRPIRSSTTIPVDTTDSGYLMCQSQPSSPVVSTRRFNLSALHPNQTSANQTALNQNQSNSNSSLSNPQPSYSRSPTAAQRLARQSSVDAPFSIQTQTRSQSTSSRIMTSLSTSITSTNPSSPLPSQLHHSSTASAITPTTPLNRSISGRHLPADWEDDETITNCNGCDGKFTMFNRKHHCRNCGLTFCGSCTKRKCELRDKGYDREVRVCERCWNQRNKKHKPAEAKQQQQNRSPQSSNTSIASPPTISSSNASSLGSMTNAFSHTNNNNEMLTQSHTLSSRSLSPSFRPHPSSHHPPPRTASTTTTPVTTSSASASTSASLHAQLDASESCILSLSSENHHLRNLISHLDVIKAESVIIIEELLSKLTMVEKEKEEDKWKEEERQRKWMMWEKEKEKEENEWKKLLYERDKSLKYTEMRCRVLENENEKLIKERYQQLQIKQQQQHQAQQKMMIGRESSYTQRTNHYPSSTTSTRPSRPSSAQSQRRSHAAPIDLYSSPDSHADSSTNDPQFDQLQQLQQLQLQQLQSQSQSSNSNNSNISNADTYISPRSQPTFHSNTTSSYSNSTASSNSTSHVGSYDGGRGGGGGGGEREKEGVGIGVMEMGIGIGASSSPSYSPQSPFSSSPSPSHPPTHTHPHPHHSHSHHPHSHSQSLSYQFPPPLSSYYPNYDVYSTTHSRPNLSHSAHLSYVSPSTSTRSPLFPASLSQPTSPALTNVSLMEMNGTERGGGGGRGGVGRKGSGMLRTTLAITRQSSAPVGESGGVEAVGSEEEGGEVGMRMGMEMGMGTGMEQRSSSEHVSVPFESQSTLLDQGIFRHGC